MTVVDIVRIMTIGGQCAGGAAGCGVLFSEKMKMKVKYRGAAYVLLDR